MFYPKLVKQWQHKYSSSLCPSVDIDPEVDAYKASADSGQRWRMCKADRCPMQRSCGFAHTRTEQVYHPCAYKTVRHVLNVSVCNTVQALCETYAAKGWCNQYYCPLAHGDAELVSPVSAWATSSEDGSATPDSVAQPCEDTTSLTHGRWEDMFGEGITGCCRYSTSLSMTTPTSATSGCELTPVTWRNTLPGLLTEEEPASASSSYCQRVRNISQKIRGLLRIETVSPGDFQATFESHWRLRPVEANLVDVAPVILERLRRAYERLGDLHDAGGFLGCDGEDPLCQVEGDVRLKLRVSQLSFYEYFFLLNNPESYPDTPVKVPEVLDTVTKVCEYEVYLLSF